MAVREERFAGAAERPSRFTAAITREGGWYVARCLEVELASQGRTIEDALAGLREALELYLEDEADPDIGPPPMIAPLELHRPA